MTPRLRSTAAIALALAALVLAACREPPPAPEPSRPLLAATGPAGAADDERADAAPAPLPAGYSPRPPGTLTFAKDIAPLVFETCAPCHRGSGVAPFELLTHAQVRKRGRQIRRLVLNRTMPPWLPAPGLSFLGERRLSDDQIGMLAQWIDEGLAEGDPAALPPVPTWPDGWLLGPPDLVVTPAEAYTLRADGPDQFRNLVLPVPLGKTRYVRAIDVRPGNPRVVHHVTIELALPSARARDAADPAPGFDGMALADSRPPPGHLVGWTPGRTARLSEEDMAWPLEAGTDLLVQLHLRPSGKVERVQPMLGLYLTDQPPSRLPVILMLRNDAIDIPAGATAHVVEDRLTLPAPVHVLGISPHAHYLASTMEVFATLPDGSRTELLRIDDWDFNWQDRFTYAHPIPLPKGAEITMRYAFDNSAGNPQNPSDPPRRVVFGPESSDEMATLGLQVLPQDPGDRASLDEALWRRQLERDPGSWEGHHTLATIALTQQRTADAIAHLESAVAINPAHAPGHYDLGVARASAGRTDDALRSYERAIQVDPTHAAAHRNAAQILVARGDLAAAIELLRTAVRLRPDHLDTRFELGAALARAGDLAGAEDQLRAVIAGQPGATDARRELAGVLARAGRIPAALDELRAASPARPSDAQAHFQLGLQVEAAGAPAIALGLQRRAMELDRAWAAPCVQAARLLIANPAATTRDAAEALALARRAADLTENRNAVVLDTLATCHALSGQLDAAITVGGRALELARSEDPELAQRIAGRIEAYRAARAAAPRQAEK